jgi:hypothetical protein
VTSSNPELQGLIDDRAIRDVILRYCRGVDRMDRELVRSCYHDGATDSHGSFEGSVDDYLEWVWKVLGRYSMTQHFVANCLVELLDDQRATVETYGVALHRSDEHPDDPTRNLVTGFRFVDRFELRDSEWRIIRRVGVTEWSRVERPADRWSFPAAFVTGRRDRTDPVYEVW